MSKIFTVRYRVGWTAVLIFLAIPCIVLGINIRQDATSKYQKHKDSYTFERYCLGCQIRPATRLSETFPVTYERYDGRQWQNNGRSLGASWLCDICKNPGINNRVWESDPFQHLEDSNLLSLYSNINKKPSQLFYTKSPATLKLQEYEEDKQRGYITSFVIFLFAGGFILTALILNSD